MAIQFHRSPISLHALQEASTWNGWAAILGGGAGLIEAVMTLAGQSKTLTDIAIGMIVTSILCGVVGVYIKNNTTTIVVNATIPPETTSTGD